MIIPITLAPPLHHKPPSLQPTLAKLTGSEEVVLIELQGSLDVIFSEGGGVATETDRRGGVIGTMSVENGKPVLTIGHHLLEGKFISLSKPLAVLSRRVNDEEVAGEDSNVTSSLSQTHYDVITLVKRKITFLTRPVPIVKQS